MRLHKSATLHWEEIQPNILTEINPITLLKWMLLYAWSLSEY
jgi:hypothetical protein